MSESTALESKDGAAAKPKKGVGMGGTWREGHFDTGFGFKK